MMELFAFATVWFWALIVIASVLIMAALEHSRSGVALVIVILSVCAIHFFGGINVFAAMKAHPGWTLGAIGAYFVVGAIWSIIKWWFRVREIRTVCLEVFKRFEADWEKLTFVSDLRDDHCLHAILKLEDKEYDDADVESIFGAMKKSDPELKKKFWDYFCHNERYKEFHFEYKPDHRRYRGLILMWMIYWPWSMIWTLINDPIRKAFQFIYRQISGTLSRISENAFKDIQVK